MPRVSTGIVNTDGSFCQLSPSGRIHLVLERSGVRLCLQQLGM